MKAQFRILSGSRSGQVEVHSRKEITVGRHPSCDFRFDPDKDLDVSGASELIQPPEPSTPNQATAIT